MRFPDYLDEKVNEEEFRCQIVKSHTLHCFS